MTRLEALRLISAAKGRYGPQKSGYRKPIPGWAMWPVLPMVRYDTANRPVNIGCMIASKGATVFMCSYDLAYQAWTRGGMTFDSLDFQRWASRCPRKNFIDFSDIISQGWSPAPITEETTH